MKRELLSRVRDASGAAYLLDAERLGDTTGSADHVPIDPDLADQHASSRLATVRTRDEEEQAPAMLRAEHGPRLHVEDRNVDTLLVVRARIPLSLKNLNLLIADLEHLPHERLREWLAILFENGHIVLLVCIECTRTAAPILPRKVNGVKICR